MTPAAASRTVVLEGASYQEHDLDCPEPGCGSKLRLRPSRFGLFYGCERFPACRSTHGAHPNGKPLGVPATAEVKKARIAAHDAFDRLWKGGGMKRKAAYRWLTQAMGRERQVHIGEMGIEDCRRVVELVRQREAGAER